MHLHVVSRHRTEKRASGAFAGIAVLASVLAHLSVAAAQQPPASSAIQPPANRPALITLRGTTYDSLSMRPLAGATVRMLGRMQTVLSDANGTFHFDSVALGEYMLVMEHPRLDSLGLPEVATRARMSADRHDVTMSIPGFATLWRGACGATKAPSDSGLIYGAVRDADSRNGLANARVLVSWTDIGLNKNKLQQVRFTHETRSDSAGAYVTCGIPLDVALQISAYPDKLGSGTDTTATVFDLPARASRIQRRDLLVATNNAGRAALTGSVRGRVTNESGLGFPGVQVVLDGNDVLRTDSAGNYSYNSARAGTHTIQFSATGREPVSRVIDIAPGNTVLIGAKLDLVATTVIQAGMRDDVRSLILRDFERRKIANRPLLLDSVMIRRRTSMAEILRFASPYVTVERPMGLIYYTSERPCKPFLYVDNVMITYQQFWNLSAAALAWVEFYPWYGTMPLDFKGPTECGAIAAFTRQAISK